MKHEFSEGICGDGSAILRDGSPMPISYILSELQSGEEAKELIYQINRSLGPCWVQNLAECLPKS
jgi:hypothetical protein